MADVNDSLHIFVYLVDNGCQCFGDIGKREQKS